MAPLQSSLRKMNHQNRPSSSSNVDEGTEKTEGSTETDNKEFATERKVGFQTVTIYKFPVGIGENPSVSSGCPISLHGFEAIEEVVEDLDIYMYERSGETRNYKQLRLGPQVRTGMLVDCGYTLNQIVCATAQAMEARALRDESLQTSSWEDVKKYFGTKQKAFASKFMALATIAKTSKRKGNSAKSA